MWLKGERGRHCFVACFVDEMADKVTLKWGRGLDSNLRHEFPHSLPLKTPVLEMLLLPGEPDEQSAHADQRCPRM